VSAAETGRGGSRDAELDRVRRDYTFAFLTYRAEGTEQRLLGAYELGRKALTSGLNMLELSQVHHEVVVEALLNAQNEVAFRDIADAASAFFIEVLSTFEMAQRSFAEVRQATLEGRQQQSGDPAPPP
jgi:hypothetical protein